MVKSPEGNNPNFGERAFKFDARMGRALGFAGIALATGGAALGYGAFAGGAALFAGGSFFGAEVSDRIAKSFQKK
jgi:hypothetical protein